MNKKLPLACLTILFTSQSLTLGVAPDISAGGRHVLVLKENGEVWAWGENKKGQLGQPNIGEKSLAPLEVPTGQKACAVASGNQHSLVLLDNKEVLSFGNNSEGQLGIGDKDIRRGVVNGLSDAIAVAAGGWHSLVLKEEGDVWAFGSNVSGQLGDGTQTEQTQLVRVVGLSEIKAIATGLESSYALDRKGDVFAWGNNVYGQLGDGTKKDKKTPIKVKGLAGITEIAAGWSHTVALKGDGTVWFWGKRWNGAVGQKQVANGNENLILRPQQIEGINNAKHIAAGSEHTVIIRSDGSMVTFGSNSKGQLALGEAWPGSVIPSPQVSLLKRNVKKVTAGRDTTYALTHDGTIRAFGSFQWGQMGDGSASHATPVQVYEEREAEKIACGAFHTVILRANGNVGWLGFYDTQKPSLNEKNPNEQSYQLKLLPNLANIKQVASGEEHTLLLTSDGKVLAYGKGERGQLGDGKKTTSMVPVPVSGLTDIIAIAAGGNSSLAIKRGGTVVTWGANELGQLGDGTATDQPEPVNVLNVHQVAEAAMGKDHVVARNKEGSVWIWGNNREQQLLPNAAPVITSPQEVPQLKTGVQSVAAGNGFSLARTTDGVMAWGLNGLGQLGLGNTTATISQPTPIPNLGKVTQIAAGSAHAIARLEDNTLKAWGLNDLGQLGDGTLNNQFTPVTVKGLTGITDIAAGEKHSCAIRNDHTAWSWGNNNNEQLGVSATQEHQVAIRLTADSEDTDFDGIDDKFERIHFKNLSHNGTADTDGDGLTDIQEILVKTNPTLADTDSDNLTDIADASHAPRTQQTRSATPAKPKSKTGNSTGNKSSTTSSQTPKGLTFISNLDGGEGITTRSSDLSPGDSNKNRAADRFYLNITFPGIGEVL